MKKEKVKKTALKAFHFILNPRLIFCFLIAWMITNGWSYVFFGIGTYFEIGWMVAVAGAYLAFLWLPISPEKLVTVAISIVLLKTLFPRDEKTLAVLKDMHQKLKDKFNNRKAKNKKQNKDE